MVLVLVPVPVVRSGSKYPGRPNPGLARMKEFDVQEKTRFKDSLFFWVRLQPEVVVLKNNHLIS